MTDINRIDRAPQARRHYAQPVLVKRDRLAQISGDDAILLSLIGTTT
jgi:hypothetical protein